jgi:hypothetical protein
MESRPNSIGFEGIFCEQKKTFIGFEQYEVEQEKSMPPVYPISMVSNYLC